MTEPVHKVAHWVPVTAEMAADATASRAFLDEMYDRWANPWKYPDRYPLPTFDLFPMLTRLAAWVRSFGKRDDDHESEEW